MTKLNSGEFSTVSYRVLLNKPVAPFDMGTRHDVIVDDTGKVKPGEAHAGKAEDYVELTRMLEEFLADGKHQGFFYAGYGVAKRK